ncbi:MAG TPA: DNA polymerase/3'-5' exonuclease PolX [Egibacteraceae bacterium]|nr:DNA polymerase/3'-5' exonuclease PolX [Egibacteraceae bacterium]
MPWLNDEVARRFSEIATLLKLDGADPFRVRAYERAAGAISACPVDLAELSDAEIAKLKGIGAATARKIAEFRDTGAIGMLDELKAQVPPGFTELVRVPGLGPKTIRALHEALGIDSVEALRAALERDELKGIPGLGPKSVQNLRESLERAGAKQDKRIPVEEALAVADELCARLAPLPGVHRVETAGSLRRMRETIGDVDILVSADGPAPVMAALRDSDLVVKVIAAGERKTSVLTVRGLQVDLRVVAREEFGAALAYFTGSKEHNVRVRERAVRRGLTLNEYGLFAKESGELVAGATEEDVYAALGLQWVPPTLREDTGEVDAAAEGRLPPVVRLEDVRGDLHGHSDWSGDGKATLEELLEAAAAKGYAYYALTDHAENLTMNGLSRERMLAQREEVARLQERFPGMRILHGAELNIGIDGSLDYDEDFLLGYDFTVASVHSHFPRPREEQTARIVRAMEHPAVNVIGHPTGRKIGRRPGYEIDLEAVVEAAVRTGTALEVNAHPARLDLSGDMVRRAVEGGATLAISCDAHRVGDLDLMRYGVATAQRGWATPAQILNCRDLDGLLAFVRAKRERSGA